MIKFLLLVFFIGMSTWLSAQQKSFWKEDFSSGKLPEGWVIVDSTGAEGHTYEWLLTDQPYPGSFQFDQQAPPIASGSRGYHMQYRAGVFTGEEVTKWNQRKEYPSGYFQTPAINCEEKDDVVLKFQHAFRWNNWFTAKNKGLWVGVSKDGKTWKEYDVLKDRPAATNMHEPIQEEINISEIAANQPAVYLRFFWKGMFSWYWMVDDIELSEPYANDVAIIGLESHRPEGNEFTAHDTLRIKIKNVGALPVRENFEVWAGLGDGRQLKAVVDAQGKPMEKQEERMVVFPPVDLSRQGSHKIQFETKYGKDEKKGNDVLNVRLYAAKMSLGEVTGFKKLNKSEFEFTSGYSKVKLIFYRNDIFRIWLAQDGEYTNPAGDAIVVDYGIKNPSVSVSENSRYYRFTTPACVVRVYKKPLRFALYDKGDKKMIFEEKEPLSFGAKTYQTLRRGGKEHFYGGGMQQGRFSHGGKDLDISITGWHEGQVSNPVPFYMSSNGYGVFRNTFAPGKYCFSGMEQLAAEDGMKVEYSSILSHDENRFDAFYFYGPTLKDILNDYTDITGKPFMPALWMLTMGDADCYNKPEQRVGWKQQTPDVIQQIAEKYIEHDMPRGWILPNDGYGCGYVKLDSVVQELKKRGFYTGLWTENGVDKIAYEVGKCGTRICKLDVAWVGPGYEFALNGTKAAYEGIEKNSDERGFVWSVCGWAGTQRYSTVWSGDQSGNFDYIRYHIPTITGAGLSAYNAATSDVDGIFGGSAFTYTRDLQWKVFTPIIMTMSGWAPVDKQPWLYGHPYEEINREYLRLKMRLMPYAYTYCHEAHTSGVPMVRAMVLEFPEDEVTYDTLTQYQFMSGEWMLVAPVYKRGDWRGTCEREDIYFPQGTWYDYWTGEKYEGGKWMKKYKAALDICPVFIRQGAIIPMYPQMNYVWEKPADVLTLDLYPYGDSAFDMYEDDGLSKDYRKGEFAKTLISMSAPKDKKGMITVHIGKARGDYKGRLKERAYELNVHAGEPPLQVSLNGTALKNITDADFKAGKSGWYFDPEQKKGTLKVRTLPVSTDEDHWFELTY